MYFVVAPSGLLAPETDWWTWGSESSTENNIRENRIPLDLLSLGEAETVSSMLYSILRTITLFISRVRIWIIKRTSLLVASMLCA